MSVTLPNLGFARPVNQGIRASTGAYVFVLNNDTILERDAIQVLVEGMMEWERKDPNVLGLAPKTLFLGRSVIDSVGNGIVSNGYVFNVGIGQVDLGQFDKPRQVFGLCFAAAFLTRSAFERVGVLDGSYFAYFEDIDWSYRANILGFKFYSEPRAVVHHYLSGSTRNEMTLDEKYYLIHRNLIRTILKNYSPRNLTVAVRQILRHTFHAFENASHMRFAKGWVELKIVITTICWLPVLLTRNLKINLRRYVSDDDVWRISAERIVQISGDTFHPETYSPYVGLDVIEEILQHMARKVNGAKYFESYLQLHAINYLFKSGLVDFNAITAGKVRGTPKASRNQLRVNPIVSYSKGDRLFVAQDENSYMVDGFVMNLLLALGTLSVSEIADGLLGAPITSAYYRLASIEGQRIVFDVFVSGLSFIVGYLTKAGLIEGLDAGQLDNRDMSGDVSQ